jgi:photosystem II stability/assembly factor-like uncharacterized protein
MTMQSRDLRRAVAAVTMCVGAAVAGGRAQVKPSDQPLALQQIPWRHIGPAAFGGRIDDIEAVPANPSTIFVGTASGGVFKSVNNGVTWRPVFDRDGSALSIGDIAIAPSDPNIVWVGTGEPNNRQSSSWGDGVYQSLDGGETWTHRGLKDSHHVGRIAIHPRNPDVVFVAALGHLWGPNEQRGLYRTKDGGRTWEKVLGVNADTGVCDVVVDQDGRTVFAATYQRRRRGWGFVGGGAGGGLHRSLDGGTTWEKLTSGLPAGNVGRIGIEISKSHPNIVYALVEHKEGGVFRSDDRGSTWTRQNRLNPRPSYYSQIRVDPKNPDKVWVLGLVYVSLDGGKTFRSDRTADKVHTDLHALWIDPNNTDHLMLGGDGGLYFSYDGSRAWEFIDNLPIGQYYDVDVDGRDPYWIYGGTQDNGTWAIPIRTSSQLGITNNDVVNIAYGDGFYVAIDPKDHRTVYANSQSGRAYLVDLDTREEKGIRPVPKDPKEQYRFNWSAPMLMSPHDSKVVYYGGNRLFRTADRGQHWSAISPDLTRNDDWKKLPIMGERNADTLSRDDGVSDFGTITTIAESPREAGLVYVGTDDGNVQMTRDGGKTWRDLTEKFRLPGARWVSRVLASSHQPGTAYVTFDGHQDDDFKPYIFRTTDFGATWSPIANDIPDGTSVHALAEHPRNANLLFAGTEFGLFVSANAGRNWVRMEGTLPRVRIDDVLINARDNDLILGTHGRSIIVLDDLSMLEHVTPAVLTEAVHLFPARTATEYYMMRALPSPGAFKFSGPNPEEGAPVTYYLKDDPPPSQKTMSTTSTTATTATTTSPTPAAASTVTIQILDKGTVVRELQGPDRKGFNRVVWDLRHPLAFAPGDDESWFGPPRGPLVVPGRYTIKLRARGRELTENVDVRVDPRAGTNPDALQQRFTASRDLNELGRAYFDAAAAVDAMDKQVQAINAALKDKPGIADVTAAVDEVSKKLSGVKEKFTTSFGTSLRFRIIDLLGQLQASTTAPTEAQLTALAQITDELTEAITRVNALMTNDLPGLEARLKEKNISPYRGQPIAPPKPRYQSTLAPTRSTRGGTMASGRRNELPELQLVF